MSWEKNISEMKELKYEKKWKIRDLMHGLSKCHLSEDISVTLIGCIIMSNWTSVFLAINWE